MKLIGKCEPTQDALENAHKQGWDAVELYLEQKHLNNFEETVKNCEEAAVDVAVVHTPHVGKNNILYFEKTDELAQELDARVVLHSSHLDIVKEVPHALESINIESEFGIETSLGISLHAVENHIFNEGRKLTFDISHMYTGVGNYKEQFETLFEEHCEDIAVIHLCDGTKRYDGLPIGEGEIDIEWFLTLLQEKGYEGPVTLEVMNQYQEEGKEKVESILNE